MNSNPMERKYCGQLTNNFESCQRFCRIGRDSCGYHKSIDEVPLEQTKRKTFKSKSTFSDVTESKKRKGTSKKVYGPKKGTISYKICSYILEGSLHGRVTRNAIKKHMIVHNLIKKENIINLLLKRMTEKGFLIQNKQSFKLSRELKTRLLYESGQI